MRNVIQSVILPICHANLDRTATGKIGARLKGLSNSHHGAGRLVCPPGGFAQRAMASSATASPVTGMPPGPWQVGVTTVQLDDYSRKDPDTGGPRRLQTEIWYPAGDDSIGLPRNRYSEFLGRGVIPGSIKAAEEPDAIGGYSPGLSIEQLDATWPNVAVRDARPCPVGCPCGLWPLVVFSHGSGAFRASYIYFTEFLASHGFIVVACDHVGSARYTQVDGEVIKPGGSRSERKQMEYDRPKDLLFLIDAMEKFNNGADSRFAGRIDTSRVAVTGMSFGGWATAAAIETQDSRIKAAICKCPSLKSDGGRLPMERSNRDTPVLMMLGAEDTVIGAHGNQLCRTYYETHQGPKFLLEINAGGHCSFTSCELYNPDYGNGIGESHSLSKPNTTYTPLPIEEQHRIINTYSLAFLNAYLRPELPEAPEGVKQLQENTFGDKITYSAAIR